MKHKSECPGQKEVGCELLAQIVIRLRGILRTLEVPASGIVNAPRVVLESIMKQ
jgi:hypothetical protein